MLDESVIKLREQGVPISRIAQRLNKPRSSLANEMARAGLSTRPLGKPCALCKCLVTKGKMVKRVRRAQTKEVLVCINCIDKYRNIVEIISETDWKFNDNHLQVRGSAKPIQTPV